MKIIARDPLQVSQRVRVGMIGLASVFLLIGLAAAVFSTANRDRPLIVAGGARPDVVANLSISNDSLPVGAPTSEPLAELGVTPAAATDQTAKPKAQGPNH